MKICLPHQHRIHFIWVFMLSLCLGCAGAGQKFDEWQSALKEKINFGDSQTSAAPVPQSGNPAPSDQDADYFIHTSKWSWETLACVAEWYTSDSENWKSLAAANPRVDPHKIAVGSEIAIPVKLLKTRKPLPRDFTGKSRRDYYAHTVRWPGESLSLIAQWYTGAPQNWRKIIKANPRINPNRIMNGDVIMIPPDLLKTREPLPRKVAAKHTSNYFAYTVKKDGEKMVDIAKWYTGNPANWKLLAKVNPDLKPDRLKPGDEVYIPDSLLKNQKPLPPPESATAVSEPAPKMPPAEPETQLEPDEKIKLFGPKEFPRS